MEKIQNWFNCLSKKTIIILGVIGLIFFGCCKSCVNDSIDNKCRDLNYTYTLNEIDKDAHSSVLFDYLIIGSVCLIGYGCFKPKNKDDKTINDTETNN